MRYRIGIIGFASSVDRIMDVSVDYSTDVQFIPFPFQSEQEMPEILQKARHKVDGWLFSGPMPYELAKPYLQNDYTADYCPTLGAGLYRTIIQIMARLITSVPRVSIDMYKGMLDIESVIGEMGINFPEIHIKYFEDIGSEMVEQVARFHQQLWLQGKLDYAITAVAGVRNCLEEMGVPVMYLPLTKQEIAQGLKLLSEKIKTNYFRTSQVGTVVISISDYAKLVAKNQYASTMQMLDWKLKGILLPLSATLNGYLIDKGSGRYVIFSSRGVVENYVQAIQEALAQMNVAINFVVPIHIGIGYGETVAQAEFNAQKALLAYAERKQAGLVIIEHNGKMVELDESGSHLEYDYFSDDPQVVAQLHQAAVSVKTFRKLVAAVNSFSSDRFTVAQMAAKLAVSEQNIRRILGSLAGVELVHVVGEELSANRGRPGKIYKLNI